VVDSLGKLAERHGERFRPHRGWQSLVDA